LPVSSHQRRVDFPTPMSLAAALMLTSFSGILVLLFGGDRLFPAVVDGLELLNGRGFFEGVDVGRLVRLRVQTQFW